MANEIRSEEFVIIWSGNTLARCDDFSMSANKKEIDTTTLDSSGFTEFILGNKTIELSTNALYTRGGDFDVLLNEFMTSDEPVTVSLSPNTSGDKYLSGSAHILSLDFSGSKEDIVKYSCKIKFTGNVSLLTVS